MYKQVLDPVGDSLFYSSLFALIPIVTLFVMLGGLRMAAHIAALVALDLRGCRAAVLRVRGHREGGHELLLPAVVQA